MSAPRIIVVTGANRGIGRAICQQILSRPGLSPLQLFATSRSGEDLGFRSEHATRKVSYPRLDVSSIESIRALKDEITQHGSVDVLINNAGVNLEAEYGLEAATRTLDVNYRGMLEMCQTFIPHLSRTSGRIVNMSSVASSLQAYSEAMRARFNSPSNTLHDLDQLCADYLSAVAAGNEEASGFGPPPRAYSVSKALTNALTAALARDNPGLVINACCPGWVATDMGRLVGTRKVQPPKTPEEGARLPMRLAFGEIDGEDGKAVTGRYWANESVRARGEGEVREW